jgi:hypothetical protein
VGWRVLQLAAHRVFDGPQPSKKRIFKSILWLIGTEPFFCLIGSHSGLAWKITASPAWMDTLVALKPAGMHCSHKSAIAKRGNAFFGYVCQLPVAIIEAVLSRPCISRLPPDLSINGQP